MHFRLSLWMAFFAFLAAGALRAQAPASGSQGSTGAAMPPGQIKAVNVVGKVSMQLNGVTTELHDNDSVSQAATVVTAPESSVILVFSNGATTQLGADTSMTIDEFLQDPFSQQIAVANLTAEPTTSRTKLHLTHGELIGKVAHLNHDKGSTFIVETPVGAAGIRGTTFRIIFRPTGTGQAFVFSLSTLEGNVGFQQHEHNGTGTTEPGNEGQGGGQQSQGGGGGSSSGGGTSGGGQSGNGVAVTTGQEVVVTVSVNVNQTTGQVTLAEPPKITSTQPISVETQTQITNTVQAIISSISATTFTSSGSSSGSTSSGTSSGSSSTSDQSSSGQQSDSSSSGTSSTSTGSTSDSNSNSGGNSLSNTNNNSASPNSTQPTNNVTNGAGQGAP